MSVEFGRQGRILIGPSGLSPDTNQSVCQIGVSVEFDTSRCI